MAKTINNTSFNTDVKPVPKDWLPTESVFTDIVKNQKEILDELKEINIRMISTLKQIEKNTFKGY